MNNRRENSHLSFRRGELAILRLRRVNSLQKFASAHGSIHNYFSIRNATSSIERPTKERRAAALAEWQSLACQQINIMIKLCAVESGSHWTDSTSAAMAR